MARRLIFILKSVCVIVYFLLYFALFINGRLRPILAYELRYL